jgi:uncharacterized protein (TIGR00369 family)
MVAMVRRKDDRTVGGIAQLRAWVADGRQPPMGRTLGIALVEVGTGRAVFERNPHRSMYSPLGTVHSGYAATLLDSACSMAIASQLEPDRGQATLELKISFVRALTEDSGTVRATGRVVSLGRRVGFAEAELHDGDGMLCATASATSLIFDVGSGTSSPPPAGGSREAS